MDGDGATDQRGRSLPLAECEEGRQSAVAFDAERFRLLAALPDIAPYHLTIEVWNAGSLGPRLVMIFSVTAVDMEAIASITNSSKTTREAALSQPLLGHLVVATEATRFRKLKATPFGSSTPFHKSLITGGQGAVHRLRCRYTATRAVSGVVE